MNVWHVDMKICSFAARLLDPDEDYMRNQFSE